MMHERAFDVKRAAGSVRFSPGPEGDAERGDGDRESYDGEGDRNPVVLDEAGSEQERHDHERDLPVVSEHAATVVLRAAGSATARSSSRIRSSSIVLLGERRRSV